MVPDDQWYPADESTGRGRCLPAAAELLLGLMLILEIAWMVMGLQIVHDVGGDAHFPNCRRRQR